MPEVFVAHLILPESEQGLTLTCTLLIHFAHDASWIEAGLSGRKSACTEIFPIRDADRRSEFQ